MTPYGAPVTGGELVDPTEAQNRAQIALRFCVPESPPD